MTVAKSQVYSPETTPAVEVDSTRDGILTMWLEAISGALSDYWQAAAPELKLLAKPLGSERYALVPRHY